MKIHDTLSNIEKEVNITKEVGIYLCGVTVYDESHIGHARTIIIFDVLRKFLESNGIAVKFIQNFTDVDDKIINRAIRENTKAAQISSRYIQNYYEDFGRLRIKQATEYPKATDHIDDMINLIKDLVGKKIAYVSDNGVYFSVSKFSDYGKLSKKNIDDLKAGSRIDVDEKKENPVDFALWKFSEVQPLWDSPWGKGRPGWHIECSAMSIKYLGENFEIHGGGRDLIFPHHENEIAQSEAHTTKPFAKIWMHVGMITINGEKMSKSLGNIKTVKYVLDNWGPNVIRLFCLAGHYSKPIDYSENLLGESVTKWRQIESCYFELIHASGDGVTKESEEFVSKCKNEFDSALNSDLNTHQALLAFFNLVNDVLKQGAEGKLTESIKNIIFPIFEKMCYVLGLSLPEISQEEKIKIDTMIQQRNQLREEKKFQDADNIRDKIIQMGIELVDHKDKTIWVKKETIKSEI